MASILDNQQAIPAVCSTCFYSQCDQNNFKYD